MTRKTLVFCCNSLWGIVNFRARVIEALVRDGHRVVAVAPEDVPRARVEALGAEYVPWRVSARGLHPLRELASLWQLRTLYASLRPDFAFHFTIKPVMYGAIAAWSARVRAVSVITGLGYLFLGENLKSRFGRWLYRVTLHRSDRVWFLNAEDRAYFERAGLLRGLEVETLPGEGVDLAHFEASPLPDPPAVFLMIARLVRDKGVFEYAEAARAVRATHPQAAFRLLGPHYAANAASVPQAVLDEWTASGTVEYLGAADDVRPAIRDAHCVVLPSYREGMPRVLMEAGAMGRPQLATDVAGCRDIVDDGVTGWLCAPRDAGSLADACRAMLDAGSREWQRRGAAARDRAASCYGDERIIARYRQVVSAPASRDRGSP